MKQGILAFIILAMIVCVTFAIIAIAPYLAILIVLGAVAYFCGSDKES